VVSAGDRMFFWSIIIINDCIVYCLIRKLGIFRRDERIIDIFDKHTNIKH